jgi:hypothetical protein
MLRRDEHHVERHLERHVGGVREVVGPAPGLGALLPRMPLGTSQVPHGSRGGTSRRLDAVDRPLTIAAPWGVSAALPRLPITALGCPLPPPMSHITAASLPRHPRPPPYRLPIGCTSRVAPHGRLLPTSPSAASLPAPDRLQLPCRSSRSPPYRLPIGRTSQVAAHGRISPTSPSAAALSLATGRCGG